MSKARETGVLRENSPANGIVRHDYHVRSSGLWPRWESNPSNTDRLGWGGGRMVLPFSQRGP